MKKEQFNKLYHVYNILVNALPETTEAQKARKNNARRYLSNAFSDCGAFGRVREILNTRDNNNKKLTVARQGKTDNLILINGRLHKVEVKTNGGRLEMLNADGELYAKYKDSYIVYSIDLCNATTSYKERVTGQRLLTMTDFIDLLKECNAIKKVSGKKNVDKNLYAIQPSSKALYNRLLEYDLI